MTSLRFCLLLLAAGWGGTTSNIDGGPGSDGGSDATTDATTSDVASNDAVSDVVVSDAPFPDSGGGSCTNGGCTFGFLCCQDECINKDNDPYNCGGCGIRCTGSTSMCFNGKCQAPTCNPACTSSQTCCEIEGPGPSGLPKCVDGPTCPVGCPECQ